MKTAEQAGFTARDGFYYLHTNGDLIFKRARPDPSDFVRRVWPLDVRFRETAWFIVIEANALGARPERIQELVDKWNLTDDDALEFAKSSQGVFRLFRDGDAWCATFSDFVNIQESQCGFGDTALEALTELAKPGLLGATP